METARGGQYLVVGLDIQLNLLAGKSADSELRVSCALAVSSESESGRLLDLHNVWLARNFRCFMSGWVWSKRVVWTIWQWWFGLGWVCLAGEA